MFEELIDVVLKELLSVLLVDVFEATVMREDLGHLEKLACAIQILPRLF